MTFPRLSLSIRKWWPALALAGLMPLIVAIVALFVMLTDLQTETMQNGLRRYGAAGAAQIDQLLSKELALAAAMTQSSALDSGDIPSFRILAARMAQQNPDWQGMMLTDQHSQLVNTALPPGAPIPAADAELLDWVWATAMPAVGDWVGGSVRLRQPVLRDGAVRYTVTIALKPEALSRALANIELPPQWRASLVDGNNIVIGRTVDADRRIGTPANRLFNAMRAAGPDAVSIGHGPDGVANYSVVVPIKETGWSIAVFVPLDVIAAPYRRIDMMLFLAMGLLALAALSFTGMTLYRIKRSTDQRASLLERDLLVAETLSRDKSGLLNGMNHELRTPLNAILGFAQLIRQAPADAAMAEQVRDYADNIEISAGHLLSMINDMLDLARIESGKMKLAESEIELGGALRTVERIMREQALKAGVDLVLDLDGTEVVAQVDEIKIKQCVLNLVSNAIKFTPAGGRVRVSMAVSPEGVRIAVADNGIGIQPEDFATVFDEFGQIDSGQGRKSKGSGLGMPLAKKFIEMHGGAIFLQSAAGRGTTVTLFVPGARILAVSRRGAMDIAS